MKKKTKRAIAVTAGLLGATYVVMRTIAKNQNKRDIYKTNPEEQNPMYKKRVVFVEDENDEMNADGKCGHLVAVGDIEHIPTFYEKYVKRGIDIALSFGGMVVLAPVYAGTALAIKLDDPGEAIFHQKRIAEGNGYFTLIKFRSMSKASDIPTHMLSDGGQSSITRVGKVIRKLSIDELPQLWSIFKGDMSIIGPRPALWNQDWLTAERSKYGANDIKPGLTGLAQISGRDALEIPDKARYDGEYTKALSESSLSGFKMDCKVFFGTVKAVLCRDGVVEGGTGELSKENGNDFSDYGFLKHFDIDKTRKIKVLITGAGSYIGTSFEAWANENYPNIEVDSVDTIDGTWREKDFSQYPAMWIRRKSLYECMCDTIPGTMTLDFLKDDSKSAEYIRNTLKDQNYVHPEQNAAVYSIAQGRARHSAVTFLLGLVFQNFHLFEKIFTPIDVKVKNIEDANKYIWLRSALYHDIGMTSDLILKRNLSLKNDFKHYLYTDDYDDLIELNEYISKSNGVLAFSYSEILRYGLYIKNERHKKNADTVEKDRLEYKSRGIIDHGILGGSILFDRYAEKLHGFELKVLKVVSLTISQHNMYKADADSDSAYRKYGLNKLLSTSNYKLSSQTPLLLFLSLIDTIECVKTFSKGNNPDKYLETITVLKSIYISVDRNTIRIDYSQLKKLASSKGDQLLSTYVKYIKCVKGLEDWTMFNVKSVIDDVILEISLK